MASKQAPKVISRVGDTSSSKGGSGLLPLRQMLITHSGCEFLLLLFGCIYFLAENGGPGATPKAFVVDYRNSELSRGTWDKSSNSSS